MRYKKKTSFIYLKFTYISIRINVFSCSVESPGYPSNEVAENVMSALNKELFQGHVVLDIIRLVIIYILLGLHWIVISPDNPTKNIFFCMENLEFQKTGYPVKNRIFFAWQI